MDGFKKVAHVDDIPLGKMKPLSLTYDRIVICHTDDGFYALADECSHDSAPISDGRIDRNGNIVCPRHGAKFCCKTGDVVAPPAVVGIDNYELKIDNNEIFIKLGD